MHVRLALELRGRQQQTDLAMASLLPALASWIRSGFQFTGNLKRAKARNDYLCDGEIGALAKELQRTSKALTKRLSSYIAVVSCALAS